MRTFAVAVAAFTLACNSNANDETPGNSGKRKNDPNSISASSLQDFFAEAPGLADKLPKHSVARGIEMFEGRRRGRVVATRCVWARLTGFSKGSLKGPAEWATARGWSPDERSPAFNYRKDPSRSQDLVILVAGQPSKTGQDVPDGQGEVRFCVRGAPDGDRARRQAYMAKNPNFAWQLELAAATQSKIDNVWVEENANEGEVGVGISIAIDQRPAFNDWMGAKKFTSARRDHYEVTATDGGKMELVLFEAMEGDETFDVLLKTKFER